MHLGVGGLIGIRVIQGIFQGLAYPSCHALFAKWSPDTEKSRMISLSICGSYFGTVIANLTAGSLAVQYGWASIFYTFGAIGLVWFILWVLIVRKSPQSDKWITQKEKDYIMNNISSNAYGNLKTPWKKLFTSVPVLAVTINHFCFNWGHYTFLTELPIYLKDALKFDLESTGFVASLPYITVMTISSITLANKQIIVKICSAIL
jgi:ACS family sodium-dependent inorganic phosphate cotransporter